MIETMLSQAEGVINKSKLAKRIGEMSSVLDKIATFSHFTFCYDGWRNGKTGSISNIKGDFVYRFIEMDRDHNGHLYEIHRNNEDNPVVIQGIVGWWLHYKKNSEPLIEPFRRGRVEPLAIKEMFDVYTQKRYEQFKDQHRDNPDTLFWNWDLEFYARHIIPFEKSLNKTTEALFDYISDDDISLVRNVMDTYILYLEESRAAHVKPIADEELRDKISLYFKDEETAGRFLKQLRAIDKDGDKMALVRKYKNAGLCLNPSKALWRALNDAQLYTKGYTNWNQQLIGR